jgi:GT2 family glycosyltransferase
MKIGVSVGILTFNEEANIRRALNSLATAPTALPYEIIVVDNGSTDQTCHHVQKFAEDNRHLSLRFIKSHRNNLGFARALIVDMAQFSTVAFLDADCEAPTNWLINLSQHLTAATNRDASIAAVGSGNHPPPEINNFYDTQRLMFKSYLGNLNSTQVKTFARSCDVTHLSTCNVLYRKEALLKVGNFSSQFGRVCEDVDLSCRLKAAGYSLRYVPGVEVSHYSRPGLSNWAQKMFRYGYGNVKVMTRHRGHRSIRLLLPLLFALLWMGGFICRPNLTGLCLMSYLIVVTGLSWSLQTNPYGWRKIAGLVALFVVTHFAYAFGELMGVLNVFKFAARTEGG